GPAGPAGAGYDVGQHGAQGRRDQQRPERTRVRPVRFRVRHRWTDRRRRAPGLNRPRRIALIVYVSTDNAQVDGDKIDINAPTTGTLTRWTISKGSTLRANQIVGRVKILNSFAEPQRAIRSPGNGTVAVSNVVEGQYVTAGTELATAYDFAKIYFTARVDETDIGDVHPGQLVDIDVDAYPGAPVTGTVAEIQGAAAGLLSLFPESNSSGNFQKVTQVIPVKIAITNTAGSELIPGMNVTVHIHKH
ncbi:MAG: hypothetical protein QOD82_2117, partial [Pseudonocardiales bacterium]|nr:hypothetical protein [Pseudonocardiales bacterium]